MRRDGRQRAALRLPALPLLPCVGPTGRGNCVRTGRGLSPVQTLFRLVTGDGVGDWVGDVMGLLSWVPAWGTRRVRRPRGSRPPAPQPAPPPSPAAPESRPPSCRSSPYLSAAVRVVQLPRLLPPLLQAVVLTVAPLHHGGVLGGLGAIGDVQLHHHHAGARRGNPWGQRTAAVPPAPHGAAARPWKKRQRPQRRAPPAP